MVLVDGNQMDTILSCYVRRESEIEKAGKSRAEMKNVVFTWN